MIYIGISADLSPNGSIHQDTFIRAVKMAEDKLKLKEKGIELIWENDFATAEGGTIAATNLLKHGVQAVVGHYASSAAKNALEVYANKIPVFLPAATADELTSNYQNAYRTCGSDSDLASFIKKDFESKPECNLFIAHDHSTHGYALSNLIIEKLGSLDNVNLIDTIKGANKIIFVGNFDSSIVFIEEHQEELKLIDEVIFTDDLVRPELPKRLDNIDQKVVVFGCEHASQCKSATRVNNLYYKQWSDYPLTYFLETYAALEIVGQLFTNENPSNWDKILKENTWKTCIGEVSFDKHGNSNFKRFAKWSIENTQLVVVENYN